MHDLTPEPDPADDDATDVTDRDEAPGDGDDDEVADVSDDATDDDDDDTDDDADDDAAEGGQVEYEVDGWSGQSRALLTSMLTNAGVRHAWQGATLVVNAADETRVEDIIAEVEVGATSALDGDRERVVYEVGSWSSAMQSGIADALGVADIPYEWDEQGDLVVYADDEDRVEEIFDAMPDPDDPETASADDADPQAVLSAMWAATGDLARDPDRHTAVIQAIEAAETMERMSLPFGFEPAVWRDIVGKSAALRAALDSEDPDAQLSDDDLKEGCRELHEQLRTLV